MLDYVALYTQKMQHGLNLPLTVLKPTVYTSLGIDRGVLLCSPAMLRVLLNLYSQQDLKQRWFIIDSLQSFGYGENTVADVHLIASPQLVDTYIRSPYGTIPFSTLGDGGDFANPTYFYPKECRIQYDIILVASWAPFKRHMRLLQAANYLKDTNRAVSILIVGSYCVPGHVDTMQDAVDYEHGIRQYVTDNQLNVEYIGNENTIHTNDDGSTVLGVYTKQEINTFINQARIGVLTSHREGTTRFVAECLCANRPVVMLNSSEVAATKFINSATGIIADDTPAALSDAILSTLTHLDRFNPRSAFLSEYGYFNSNRMLERTISDAIHKQGDDLFSLPNCRFGGDMWSFDYYNIFAPIMDYGRVTGGCSR